MLKHLLLNLILFASLLSSAQSTSQKDSAIQINKVKISVDATRYSASTVVEIELFNPNSKVLDGEINFSLAEGQLINNFQLDINGHMRNGVVIEKQQARIAYENVVRRKVDPGLLEMTAANQYRVRVYPVPANGKRLIAFTVQQLLHFRDNQADYIFPLQFSNPVKDLTAEIAVHGEEMPFTTTGLLEGQLFTAGKRKQLVFHSQTVPQNSWLQFSIPLNTPLTLCRLDSECEPAFLARIKLDSLSVSRTTPSTVTIFWDVSASATKRNLQKELDFLAAYLQSANPQSLTLITFAIDVVREQKITTPAKKIAAIKQFLTAQKTDGGTRLNTLHCNNYPADEYMLFSDGHNTFGEGTVHMNNKPLFAIQSAVGANTSLMKQLAGNTGGKLVDLSLQNVTDAIASLQQPLWKPVFTDQQTELFDLQLIESGQSFLVKGLNKQNADSLVLAFAYGGVVKRVVLHLKNIACYTDRESNANTVFNWQQTIKSIANSDSLQTKAIEQSIVTATTSLIVLDAVEDYYQYGIAPPAELLEEFRKRYPPLPDKKEEKQKEKEWLVYNKLKQSVDEYNEKMNWWNPDLKALHIPLPTENAKSVAVVADKTEQQNNANNNSAVFKSNALSEVVVTAVGASRRRAMAGSATSVSGYQLQGKSTVQQALQGRVSGLAISGSLGASAGVTLRGMASIRGGGEPLYILDGIPVDAAIVLNMPTFDIENITVLKDAASVVLYGSGAGNGAIVVTTKKGKLSPPAKQGEEEEETIDELIDSVGDVHGSLQYDRYLEIKKYGADAPAFYFSMADYFFRQKMPKEALRVLSNLAEMRAEDHQLLRAIGYMLEEWKDYPNAIEIYKMVLKVKEEEPQSYRDLALAYAMTGSRREALDLLYKVLSKDWGLYENRYQGLREIMMTELNTLAKDDTLGANNLNKNLLQLLPVDLRIVVDWNKDETDIDLHVLEPGGEECSYNNRTTRSGGRISKDFTQGYGPEEYEIKKVAKGTYKVKVDYYGDRYQKQQVPSFIKLTVFKNYGRPNQTLFVKTIKLEGSERMIDLADIKF